MSSRAHLKVALVGGPMYDHLYQSIPKFEAATGHHVEVAVHLNHPMLNARMAQDFAEGADPGYDLISTHTKYAPSQRQYLLPLDEFFEETELSDFSPSMLEHARIEGKLYGIPRNIDVKLLYYRTDRFENGRDQKAYKSRFDRDLQVPATWLELRDVADFFTSTPEMYGFVFPGRYSGLFGHFFELDAMAGGHLFGENHEFNLVDAAGRWALGFLANLYQSALVPPQVPEWHYDEVTRFFLDGGCAMTTDWPGGFHLFKNPATSKIAGRFGVALYPVGAGGKRYVYSGSHTFAIPRSVRRLGPALELIRFLTSESSQYGESTQGAIAVRLSVGERVRAEAAPNSLEASRLDLLQKTVDHYMLMPPKFPEYPQVEDTLWTSLRSAIIGEITVEEGLRRAQKQILQMVPGATGPATS